eukprot:augustus_masked-scaffold_1-processed-gene-18.0-mRNA-1 protein AED:0.20 eAED:0.20 QI:0/-1/0/1/-1/1/1/0/308
MDKKYEILKPTVVPAVQIMGGASDALANCSGVVINQQVQLDEALLQAVSGCPFERRNKYRVAALPAGKMVMQSQNDPNGWRPRNTEMHSLPQIMYAFEESSICTRFVLGCLGCQNLRPLRMPFVAGPGVPPVLKEEQVPANQIGFTAVRGFNLGGCCCCPHTTELEMSGNYVGKVEEDWHCGKNYCQRYFQACLCCTLYFDIIEANEAKYQLVVNQACCGPHNNCFAPSCCCRNALFDIYKKNTKEVAGHIQRAFGADCTIGSCFKCCFDFSNYLVEFPNDASPVQKALIMAAVVNTEYVIFENTGGE